jgi:hypothetical protein
MSEEKFLYGAVVQDIQNFIFQTDNLKEIIGASELVESICKTQFDEFAVVGKPIVNAAGNIKHIFESREACEKAVLNFPKKVVLLAPGITISQAVVQMTGGNKDYETAAFELEKRLRTQRNKSMRSTTMGLLGMQRSRSTGLPVVEVKEYIDVETKAKIKEYIDAATSAKIKHVDDTALVEKCFGKLDEGFKTTNKIDLLTGNNNWMAVIHIDGNGMGQIVQSISKNPDQLHEFSEALEVATSVSAIQAFNEIKLQDGVVPLRPIILGGDDLTMVCRGDLAMVYTLAYLRAFEDKTNSLSKIMHVAGLNHNNLTACAGVAFVKASYPFHYAYDLAESLCLYAKIDSKKFATDNLPPSSVLFHKVQDSFMEDFDAIKERVLQPQKTLSLMHGPYYLNEQHDRWTIDKLLQFAEMLNPEDEEANPVRSNLREWLSLLYQGRDIAFQKKSRIKAILGKDVWKKFNLDEIMNITEISIPENVILSNPAYDILSLSTIIHQKTNVEE